MNKINNRELSINLIIILSIILTNSLLINSFSIKIIFIVLIISIGLSFIRIKKLILFGLVSFISISMIYINNNYLLNKKINLINDEQRIYNSDLNKIVNEININNLTLLSSNDINALNQASAKEEQLIPLKDELNKKIRNNYDKIISIENSKVNYIYLLIKNMLIDYLIVFILLFLLQPKSINN